jgi:hypothetical protein
VLVSGLATWESLVDVRTAVKFQFAHVGTDPDAESLLRRLHYSKKDAIKQNVSSLLSDKLEDIKVEEKKWTVVSADACGRVLLTLCEAAEFAIGVNCPALETASAATGAQRRRSRRFRFRY